MSHTRELGFAVQQLASRDQKTEEVLRSALGLTPQELRKFYAGRLFLTGADLRKAAEVCGVAPRALLNADREEYDARVVHCMSEFRNRENREMILDLIDAYIDAREALRED